MSRLTDVIEMFASNITFNQNLTVYWNNTNLPNFILSQVTRQLGYLYMPQTFELSSPSVFSVDNQD